MMVERLVIPNLRFWSLLLVTGLLVGCGQMRQSIVRTPPPNQEPELWKDSIAQPRSGAPRAGGSGVRTANVAPPGVQRSADSPASSALPEQAEAASIQQTEHLAHAHAGGTLGRDGTDLPPPNRILDPIVAESPTSPADTASEQQVEKETLAPTNLQDPAENLAFTRQIVARSMQFYQENPKFTCRLTRRERVNGKLMPMELMVMSFRLDPRSVYYKWLDDTNAGRELVYVDGQNDGKIITLGGKSDFLMTGKRVKVDPTGILARNNGRYPITESGMDRMMERLGGQLADLAQGNKVHGEIRYMGVASRPEYAEPLDYVVHYIPPKVDKAFPVGGVRHWYFDRKTSRLVLLHADDSRGEFLEYYLFDRFLPNPALEDQDFDPDVLWPKEKRADAAKVRFPTDLLATDARKLPNWRSS